jgi:hypothetical protein
MAKAAVKAGVEPPAQRVGLTVQRFDVRDWYALVMSCAETYEAVARRQQSYGWSSQRGVLAPGLSE